MGWPSGFKRFFTGAIRSVHPKGRADPTCLEHDGRINPCLPITG